MPWTGRATSCGPCSEFSIGWRSVRAPKSGCRDFCATNAMVAPRSAGIGRHSCFPRYGRSIAGCGWRAASWRRCRSASPRSLCGSILRWANRPPRGSRVRLPSIWLLPCVVTALAAEFGCLFRRVKHQVREAEATSERKDVVASILSARRQTAPVTAFAVGSAVVALLLKVTVPELSAIYDQHVVRGNVAAGLAAVAPLQRQVEDQWGRTGSIPRRPDYSAVVAQRNADYVDTRRPESHDGPRPPRRWGPRPEKLRARSCCSRRRSTSSSAFTGIAFRSTCRAQYLPQGLPQSLAVRAKPRRAQSIRIALQPGSRSTHRAPRSCDGVK